MRSQQQVLSNFRALFSPYSRPLPLASTSRARGLPTSRRPAARAKQAPKPESYTREMFCLASTSQNTTPNREEKEVLQRAGLGRMKIKFDARGNPQNFKEELEKTFGKLMWGGGFELLRRVPGNNLEVIQPPSVGYSVEHLKRCGLGQSMIFVRPIQSDLDLTPEDDFLGQGSSSEEFENAPKVACLGCGASVAITAIRNHQNECESSCTAASNVELSGQNNPQVTDIRMSMMMPRMQEMFPDHDMASLQSALITSEFNTNHASRLILGDNVNGSDSDSDIEMLMSCPLSETSKDDQVRPNTKTKDINKLITQFKDKTINENVPRQLFTVCRSDGIEEMKGDILSYYKNPQTNLLARMRVRFEGEEGLGAGPVREFLHHAVKLVEDGIGSTNKPIIYLEGQVDHKVPIHNPALRQTGTYRAIGRILGHSFLHDGPSLCGLAEPVKHYLTLKDANDMSLNPPTLLLEDLPDIDLRMLLEQILDLPKEEMVSKEQREEIEPYLLEAGVDLALLSSNRQMVVQLLLMYNIIEKRKLELDDIAAGMNTVGLTCFMQRHPEAICFLFPSQREATILGKEIKERMVFNDEEEANQPVISMFLEYIDVIEKRQEDGAMLTDLCCFWTGSNMLPPRSGKLNVFFDKASSNLMPMAESCFCNLTLPVVHLSFDQFRKQMDNALKYGSKGFTFS